MYQTNKLMRIAIGRDINNFIKNKYLIDLLLYKNKYLIDILVNRNKYPIDILVFKNKCIKSIEKIYSKIEIY